jgi:hypothetical protein
MGHSLNGNSTDIYFNRPWEDEVKLGEFFQAQVKLTNEQEYIELSKRGNYGKKW